MAKRMTYMLVATALFLGAIGFVKFKQIQTAIAQASSFQPPPEAVTTIVAREEHWPATLGAIGTVAAAQGVMVSADLPGIVARITFDSGRSVRQGDVLAQLDSRQEQAQLAAAVAQRDLSRLNLERGEKLIAQGLIPASDYDRMVAEHKQAEARIGEIQATIERKTIRAPFAGVLGIRQVNVGQYLDGGAPVVQLQSLSPIHVNFSLPQQQVGRVRVGGPLDISLEGSPDEVFEGRITAVDSVVDEATRNVQVQATLTNGQGRLRPGMFVQASVVQGKGSAIVPVPASAISYAPYGDSVYVVEDLSGPKGETYRGVRQQFVKLAGGRGDQVAVVSGVEPGQEVVTSGVFKLRGGAAVHVDNAVQPGNDPMPKPEDN